MGVAIANAWVLLLLMYGCIIVTRGVARTLCFPVASGHLFKRVQWQSGRSKNQIE